MVIQLIIAAFAASGAYLFIIRKKIKSLLFKNKDTATEVQKQDDKTE